MEISKEELVKYLDHSVLTSRASKIDVDFGIQECLKWKVAAYCIKQCFVEYSAKRLAGSGVKVCTVIGFPHGNSTSVVKAFEAEDAVKNGATEIDMVINIGKLIEGEYGYVEKDISAVVKTVGSNAIVKVIIQTSELNDTQKVKACELSKSAGANFVKTSVGFGLPGYNDYDIRLMRQTVGPNFGVKASGGVITYEQVISAIEAGANRFGIGEVPNAPTVIMAGWIAAHQK
jgi:deoxyribose-phosphate aldolase